jgi:hypothetical protein
MRPLSNLSLIVLAAYVVNVPAALADNPTAEAESEGAAAFDPRDLSGHWVRISPAESARAAFNPDEDPPLTPEGRAMTDRNRPGYGPRRSMERNDPLGRCYPTGLVRNLNAEIIEPHNTWEIVMTPGRVLQFFEYRHDWREIWMDGRELPELSDTWPKFNGYSVGRWEGDTLIVQSLGFDDRAWVDKFGHAHSEQMRLEERYRRLDAHTLELVMTITDPVVYSRPWQSDRKLFRLDPDKTRDWAEQIYCIAEEELDFQRLIESGNVGAR